MESQTETTQINTKAHLQTCNLGISMTRYAWTKLMAYCRSTNMETSGFMLLERDGDLLWIDDIYLLEQESTGTSTEMNSTAIAKFQLDLYKRGIIGKPGSKKKLAHWHTHPTFGVFWSGTDMEFRRINRQGVDYFVSIVVNQKGDALAAIDINGEFPMSINDLPIEVVDNADAAELIKACKAEVELKVKSPTPTMWADRHGYQGHDYTGGRTYFNPETCQWQDQKPGEPERFILESEERDLPPLITDSTPVNLMGPGDRRTRKALLKLEKLSKKIAAKSGKQTLADWRLDQEKLDDARLRVRLAQGQAKPLDKPYVPGEDAGEINIISDSVREDGIMTSDDTGTWENIGGEIVKADEASQIVYD